MEGERFILYVGWMMRVQKITRAALGALALALGPLPAAAPAHGQAVVSTGESFVDVSFVRGRAEPGGGRMTGLVLDLAPEWKTYWRSPGAAGVPPTFDWSGSRNLAEAEVLWPRPHYFESFGVQTLGYAKRVVFPIRLVPEDPARPIALGLDLAVGVCREICVLEETTVSADIAPGAPAEAAALVASAEASVPPHATAVGLVEARCRISGAGAERRLDATLRFDRPVADPSVALEGPELVMFRDIEASAAAEGRIEVAATLRLLDERAWIGRSDIRMTVLAEDFAADVRGCSAGSG